MGAAGFTGWNIELGGGGLWLMGVQLLASDQTGRLSLFFLVKIEIAVGDVVYQDESDV